MQKESSDFAVQDLITIFRQLFLRSENTILSSGAEDPLYVPAHSEQPHNIIYVKGQSFSSGLHEISHWCIAGKARRDLLDYGYWYIPGGRTAEEQKSFELVEARNQGLEWILASACEMRFYVSFDNVDNTREINIEVFCQRVRLEALHWYEAKKNKRLGLLLNTLIQKYSSPKNFAEYWTRVRDEGVLPFY